MQTCSDAPISCPHYFYFSPFDSSPVFYFPHFTIRTLYFYINICLLFQGVRYPSPHLAQHGSTHNTRCFTNPGHELSSWSSLIACLPENSVLILITHHCDPIFVFPYYFTSALINYFLTQLFIPSIITQLVHIIQVFPSQCYCRLTWRACRKLLQ